MLLNSSLQPSRSRGSRHLRLVAISVLLTGSLQPTCNAACRPSVPGVQQRSFSQTAFLGHNPSCLRKVFADRWFRHYGCLPAGPALAFGLSYHLCHLWSPASTFFRAFLAALAPRDNFSPQLEQTCSRSLRLLRTSVSQRLHGSTVSSLLTST